VEHELAGCRGILADGMELGWKLFAERESHQLIRLFGADFLDQDDGWNLYNCGNLPGRFDHAYQFKIHSLDDHDDLLASRDHHDLAAGDGSFERIHIPGWFQSSVGMGNGF
jgi:hypothetical protein